MRIKTSNVKLYNSVWRRRNKHRSTEFVNRLKMSPCVDCHVQYNPWVMQFDHRSPKEKISDISKAKGRWSIKRLKREIAKCDLVCANCHAERTHRKKHWIVKRTGIDFSDDQMVFKF